MKTLARKWLPMLLCLALALSGVAVPVSEAAAKTPAFSVKKQTVETDGSFTLKIKANKTTVKKTSWSVNKDGKTAVVLSDEKKTSVVVTGKNAGAATVKAKVTYKNGSKKKTTSLTCKVTVNEKKSRKQAIS